MPSEFGFDLGAVKPDQDLTLLDLVALAREDGADRATFDVLHGLGVSAGEVRPARCGRLRAAGNCGGRGLLAVKLRHKKGRLASA